MPLKLYNVQVFAFRLARAIVFDQLNVELYDAQNVSAYALYHMILVIGLLYPVAESRTFRKREQFDCINVMLLTKLT